MVRKNSLLLFRWDRLAHQPFWQQVKSIELYSLGLLFCVNVFTLQLYLGTARVQLEEKGDTRQVYLRTLSFIVPGIFAITPINGVLLDRLGYGIVLVIINTLSLCTSMGQMGPSVHAQV